MGLHALPLKFFIPGSFSGCLQASRLGNPLFFDPTASVSHLVLSNSVLRDLDFWCFVSWSLAPFPRQGQKNVQGPKGKDVGVIRKIQQQ